MHNLGYYGFEHSYLSRAGNKTRGKSGPLHLSAVASYMSNINKTDKGIAVNLPLERGELYSELNRYTNKIGRANGRIAETFIAYFDKRMSEDHRKEALGRFLMAVTFNGKIKARGWEHYDNPNNPHAHVMVIDEDANGEKVGHFGRSGTYRREHSPVKGNPTVWLRKLWQDECNAVLQEHGYDFRVDMRTKLEQQVEKDQEARELKIQEQLAAIPKDQQIIVEAPVDEHKELLPEAPLEPVEEIPEEEDEEATEESMATIEKEGLQSTADILKFALQVEHERKWISHLQFQRDANKDHLAKVTSQADQAVLDAAKAELEHLGTFQTEHAAAQALARYQKDDGRLRGFALKLWGWQVQSPTRKRAQEALQAYSSTRSAAEEARRTIREHEDAAERLKREAEEIARAVTELENSLKTYGTDKEVEEALAVHENTVYDQLNQLTVQQIEEAWADHLITSDEAIEALELKGDEGAFVADEIRQWEEDQSIDI